MKYTQIFIAVLIIVAISGCVSSKTRPDGFVSAIDKEKIMGRVSTKMIRLYLTAHGCNERSFDRSIVGPILDSANGSTEISSEHWVIKACEKTFNLRMDFNLKEDRVETSSYEAIQQNLELSKKIAKRAFKLGRLA